MHELRIYGIHAITALITRFPSRVYEVFYSKTTPAVQTLITQAEQAHIPLHTVHKTTLDHWFPNAVHQGVAARIQPNEVWTEQDIPEKLQHFNLVLVLDGIQDPHNLGACLRVADAMGVDAVIFAKDKNVGLTPIVRKVASGAAESVPIIQVTNLVRSVRSLQALGGWVVGTDSIATQTLYQMDLKGPIVWVLGAEDQGLRRLTREACDYLVQIPMHGMVESLNVSVSAGICLSETRRQRDTRFSQP
jgi:23S rRNA (guanosine2251-2'-O)-methyltransferase